MGAETVSIAPFSRPGAETCEYIGPEGIYWSRGPVILRSDRLDGPMRRVARIPRPFLRRVLAATRLGRRLARETVYNLLPMPDGALFFSYGTEIGFIRDGRVQTLGGRARRHRILRGGCARLADGSLVFGEYFDNAAREAVRIYKVAPGATEACEVFRFEPGEVRHIHSVSWDPFTDRVVVAAGDIGDECRIVAFSPDFSEQEVLGIGTEDFRAISPQFDAEAIYFGTDAQFTANRLFRYDRSTGALAPLAEVNGPVFYAATVDDGWVFATSAELCPSQTSPEARLYHLAAGSQQVTVLARYPKDPWPKRYFQFGILNFPIVRRSVGAIPVSGTAVKTLDGKFVLLKGA